MAFRPGTRFLQQTDFMSFRVVQVGHPTVRSLCGGSEEHRSPFAQFLVGGGDIVHPENEEPFRGLPPVSGRTSMDRQPDRPGVEVDDMAFVEEERQAEDVSVERPRPIQVFRIPDDPLDGEGHSIQLRHRGRPGPLSPFRRETPKCGGRLTIQKVTRHGVSYSTETSSSYRLVLAPVTVKTSPVERLPSPSESLSARVPFAKVPRIPLERDTFVRTGIPFSRSDACRVRFRTSSGLQNEEFAVACHGFVPCVVNLTAGTRPIGSP